MSAQPVPAVDAKKPRRTFSVNLRGAENAALRITMKLKRDGTAVTYAVHSTKDGKKRSNTRGATEHHATAEAAKAAQEKLVMQALKLGWARKERSGGFQAKPDAFDLAHLPVPKSKK